MSTKTNPYELPADAQASAQPPTPREIDRMLDDGAGSAIVTVSRPSLTPQAPPDQDDGGQIRGS